MNKLIVSVLISLLLMLGNLDVHAAQVAADHPERPRVALVLGGGGARGAAHIGVLRELERQRIPIDMVVGTSMGAIVGGLYASGMTVAELEELVATLDWGAAFQDATRREDKRFRRKQDDASFPMNLELGLRDGGLILPSGVVQGQSLGLILRELTLDVSHLRSFDALPIPFRAVAADIVTGDRAVLADGDLATSIRASMSVPGVFSPVEIDGKTLVDGGMVGNVPVSVAQDLGADIIIAVDVEFPLYAADELDSVVSISGQMLTILINKETQRQLAQLDENDFLIRPALGNFGSGNFAEVTEVLQPGQDATRALAGDLARHALSAEEYARHIASRQSNNVPSSIDFVRISDDGSLSQRVLQSRIETHPGDMVDSDKLASDASRLHGLQLYEHVDYQLVTDDDGRDGVEFITRNKSWGPNFLQFGVSLQDDLEGNTSFNVASRMTRSAVNSLGAEWRVDLQLGTDPFVFSEFYQPLSFDSRYFVAPRLQFGRSNFDVYDGGDNIARYRVSEALGGIDLGRELGLWGEIRLGIARGVGKARLGVGLPTFEDSEFDVGGVFARFNIDTQDDAQIPLRGTRASVIWSSSLESLGADANYDTFDSAINHAWTRGRHTINAGLRYGTSNDADDIIRNYFTLGGFMNLSGLQPGEVSGPHVALARLVYYRRSGEIKGSFEVPLYIGGSLEAGNAWQSRSDMSFDSALINGSAFVGINTIIGPVFLAAGFGEGGNKSLFLSIGQTPF